MARVGDEQEDQNKSKNKKGKEVGRGNGRCKVPSTVSAGLE